ncbi:hypothetical protein BU23DRAFT_252193 [Bimuria novae-zelandiae CBS 107.79]|uniref:Uncharacterized protein n=1 Tax=Bimuria novae-zelandiae CBS 107.79 TaxID=1447943 RepID=A0A6A5VNI0_9PLEO|nr:hypothetical protein BU23DRAFT_252193 [Bimuria novae-zelandiae CBS 107.79]
MYCISGIIGNLLRRNNWRSEQRLIERKEKKIINADKVCKLLVCKSAGNAHFITPGRGHRRILAQLTNSMGHTLHLSRTQRRTVCHTQKGFATNREAVGHLPKEWVLRRLRAYATMIIRLTASGAARLTVPHQSRFEQKNSIGYVCTRGI